MFKKTMVGFAAASLFLLGSAAASAQMIPLRDLNGMDKAQFEKALDGVFNKAPWAVTQTAEKRPFTGFVDLYEKLVAEVKSADKDKKMSAILGHPELACKSVRAENIAANSLKEQTASGLNECSQEEVLLIQDLNKKYKDKFGYHFMLAIKGYNKEEIINEVKARLNNDKDTEFEIAMQQIYKITMLRLVDKVK